MNLYYKDSPNLSNIKLKVLDSTATPISISEFYRVNINDLLLNSNINTMPESGTISFSQLRSVIRQAIFINLEKALRTNATDTQDGFTQQCITGNYVGRNFFGLKNNRFIPTTYPQQTTNPTTGFISYDDTGTFPKYNPAIKRLSVDFTEVYPVSSYPHLYNNGSLSLPLTLSIAPILPREDYFPSQSNADKFKFGIYHVFLTNDNNEVIKNFVLFNSVGVWSNMGSDMGLASPTNTFYQLARSTTLSFQGSGHVSTSIGRFSRSVTMPNGTTRTGFGHFESKSEFTNYLDFVFSQHQLKDCTKTTQWSTIIPIVEQNKEQIRQLYKFNLSPNSELWDYNVVNAAVNDKPALINTKYILICPKDRKFLENLITNETIMSDGATHRLGHRVVLNSELLKNVEWELIELELTTIGAFNASPPNNNSLPLRFGLVFSLNSSTFIENHNMSVGENLYVKKRTDISHLGVDPAFFLDSTISRNFNELYNSIDGVSTNGGRVYNFIESIDKVLAPQGSISDDVIVLNENKTDRYELNVYDKNDFTLKYSIPSPVQIVSNLLVHAPEKTIATSIFIDDGLIVAGYPHLGTPFEVNKPPYTVGNLFSISDVTINYVENGINKTSRFTTNDVVANASSITFNNISPLSTNTIDNYVFTNEDLNIVYTINDVQYNSIANVTIGNSIADNTISFALNSINNDLFTNYQYPNANLNITYLEDNVEKTTIVSADLTNIINDGSNLIINHLGDYSNDALNYTPSSAELNITYLEDNVEKDITVTIENLLDITIDGSNLNINHLGDYSNLNAQLYDNSNYDLNVKFNYIENNIQKSSTSTFKVSDLVEGTNALTINNIDKSVYFNDYVSPDLNLDLQYTLFNNTYNSNLSFSDTDVTLDEQLGEVLIHYKSLNGQNPNSIQPSLTNLSFNWSSVSSRNGNGSYTFSSQINPNDITHVVRADGVTARIKIPQFNRQNFLPIGYDTPNSISAIPHFVNFTAGGTSYSIGFGSTTSPSRSGNVISLFGINVGLGPQGGQAYPGTTNRSITNTFLGDFLEGNAVQFVKEYGPTAGGPYLIRNSGDTFYLTFYTEAQAIAWINILQTWRPVSTTPSQITLNGLNNVNISNISNPLNEDIFINTKADGSNFTIEEAIQYTNQLKTQLSGNTDKVVTYNAISTIGNNIKNLNINQFYIDTQLKIIKLTSNNLNLLYNNLVNTNSEYGYSKSLIGIEFFHNGFDIADNNALAEYVNNTLTITTTLNRLDVLGPIGQKILSLDIVLNNNNRVIEFNQNQIEFENNTIRVLNSNLSSEELNDTILEFNVGQFIKKIEISISNKTKIVQFVNNSVKFESSTINILNFTNVNSLTEILNEVLYFNTIMLNGVTYNILNAEIDNGNITFTLTTSEINSLLNDINSVYTLIINDITFRSNNIPVVINTENYVVNGNSLEILQLSDAKINELITSKNDYQNYDLTKSIDFIPEGLVCIYDLATGALLKKITSPNITNGEERSKKFGEAVGINSQLKTINVGGHELYGEQIQDNFSIPLDNILLNLPENYKDVVKYNYKPIVYTYSYDTSSKYYFVPNNESIVPIPYVKTLDNKLPRRQFGALTYGGAFIGSYTYNGDLQVILFNVSQRDSAIIRTFTGQNDFSIQANTPIDFSIGRTMLSYKNFGNIYTPVGPSAASFSSNELSYLIKITGETDEHNNIL